eukprot:CAMPEP_0174732348 /NCGR_PEP_ID=MMETSP1094-20130205/59247_1 /TAXON_ID=156173 /ORGANISM="Chrysochromulina brevifilum, Strain UTEX LB 985" /LENGTH=660 /DNA_ID=CAMNT_0015934853 /DNA_START=28 /DNA_END=2010 /DNA_ORIENTATION=-
MPVPGHSGVSNSSSRMHSSIYGSAMQSKPAAVSRPPSAAFRVGSAAKAFVAPISSRTAAEDRIGRHGTGYSNVAFASPPPTATGRIEPAGMTPAGRAVKGHQGNSSVGELLQADADLTVMDTVASSQPSGMTPAGRAVKGHHGNGSFDALLQVGTDLAVTDTVASSQPEHDTDARMLSQHSYQHSIFVTPPPAPPSETASSLPEPPPPQTPPLPLQPTQPPQPTYEPIDPSKAQLGKGVFANVRMTHGRDGQVIAVKTYDHKEAKQERSVAKHMLNEERLAGRIQHENIIAPQVARKGDGVTELEMEYAPGGTLEEYVKKLKRPLTEDEARVFFRQVVDAVVYLHEEGICHRDIKMENVVLDANGVARLVDFGAAREGGANSFLMSMQGTPAYMAPEVAQQRAHKGGPADIWALGVVLYNLVSGGAFPFWGRSMEELKRNISASQLRIPPHVSASCRDLLTALLHKSSATRMTAADVRRHPWLVMQEAPTAPPAAPATGAGPSTTTPPHAAPTANADAYCTESLDAARAATTKRLQESHTAAGRQAASGRPTAGPTASPSPSPSPRAANYDSLGCSARQGSARGFGQPPGTPSNYTVGSTSSGSIVSPRYGPIASPRSASKLAGLMSGNGRPGTACSQRPPTAPLGRASSAAQVGYGYRR